MKERKNAEVAVRSVRFSFSLARFVHFAEQYIERYGNEMNVFASLCSIDVFSILQMKLSLQDIPGFILLNLFQPFSLSLCRPSDGVNPFSAHRALRRWETEKK